MNLTMIPTLMMEFDATWPFKSVILLERIYRVNLVGPKWQAPPAHEEDCVHELRKDHLLPTQGFSLPIRVPQMRREVWGKHT
jgi:hypothetical protein